MKKYVLLLILLVVGWASAAYDFCDYGEQGSNLEIVSVVDGLDDNSDEWEWDLEDEIKVEVEVYNDELEDEEFVVELVFIDEDEDEVYVVVDDGDLKETFDLAVDSSDTISFRFEIEDDLEGGIYDMYVKFYQKGDENDECIEARQEVSIGKVFCENGKADDRDLEIIRIRDNNLESDTNWEWGLESEVEIEVEIENKDFGDREFDVELIFFDEDGDEVSFATDSGDLKESVDIDEDESEEVTFEFEIDEDIEEGEYSFYVVVVADNDGDICTSLMLDGGIEIMENNGVVVSSVTGLEEVSAGSSVAYLVSVENLGVLNQDQVEIVAYNYNWGVDERATVYNLGAGEIQTVSMEIDFPEGAFGERAGILFSTNYDYDEDRDYYYESSDSGYDKKHFVLIGEAEVLDNVENVPEVDEGPTVISVGPGNLESVDEGLFSNRVIVISVLVVVGFGLLVWVFRKRSKMVKKTFHDLEHFAEEF